MGQVLHVYSLDPLCRRLEFDYELLLMKKRGVLCYIDVLDGVEQEQTSNRPC